jgi:alpha 1,2-mannosyltransferase
MFSSLKALLFKKKVVKAIFAVLGLLLIKEILLNSKTETNLKREKINVKLVDKQNACFFVLTRNQDLSDLIKTITQIENAFNHNYKYPYVIVSDELFTGFFQKQIRKHTRSLVEFGQISVDEWSVPKWIDPNQLKLNLKDKKVFKNSILSYHHMCRYYSGFFFRHNLTLKYDYYWRLDSHVKFPCPIREDPFLALKKRNKLYGFTIAIEDEMNTMPTLWKTVTSFFNMTKLKSSEKESALKFVSIDGGKSLSSTCTFWNNFEVASFELFRNKDYISYFEHLDRAGGFYYERWGDAPVHTYYSLLRLRKHEIHRFEDIGYGHTGRYNWPNDRNILKKCYKVQDDEKLQNCNQRWDSLFINEHPTKMLRENPKAVLILTA